jgi:predicted nucleotidyltransferase
MRIELKRGRREVPVMNAVTLEYPEAWLAPMGTDAERFAEETKMAAAMKLFELGKLTSGQAAQFAGIGRKEFLLSCGQWGVDTVKWDSTELAAEFTTPLQAHANIRKMVLETSDSEELLRTMLSSQESVRAAFIFGSIARGEERPHSDFDLMVVGGLGLRRLTRCLSGLANRVGREINPHVFTPAEFRRRWVEGDHFLSTVLANPRIFLVGNDDELAMMGAGSIQPVLHDEIRHLLKV